jgi:N-acyl-D-aspartate/D-glutamate deacylase
MTHDHDLVIRGGQIADGSGAPAFIGDIAVADGRIAMVGQVTGRGREEIDARGLVVTPGFVDVHTHYDGQATWENRMQPSSGHGVTTVVTGNCGVGFAPVRPGHRDLLIRLMEGVEDIPGVVMAEGVPWNWESFPDYMDVLAGRQFDIDIAVQLPHSPLRVYVMGERGANHDASTAADRAEMTRLVADAVRAGALGVSTSRSSAHRFKDGTLAPSVTTADDELVALATGLRDAGSGVFQLITETDADAQSEFACIRRIAEAARRPVSFTLLESHRWPRAWQTYLTGIERANADGLEIRGQVFPRPVGVLMGLGLSLHPFSLKPSYRALAKLPLAERLAIMRDPACKARMIAEEPTPDPTPVTARLIARAGSMFALGDPIDYGPAADRQLDARAAAAGVPLDSFVYDLLLGDEGRNILYLPAANFLDCSLDATRAMLAHPNTIIGLGDGGAHYGFICDASFPTSMLIHWARDAADAERFPLEWAVAELTRRPAEAVRLMDRGLLQPGYKADINVIDLDRLTLFAPVATHDLPAGGCRLVQKATGYVATIVDGVVTYRDGEPTGLLPGRLVRGGGHPTRRNAAA